MPEDLSQLLKEFGVVRQGHFLLTSGMHSDRYFEKFRILERPNVCEHFARALANNFQNMGVTVVCGPTTGGVIVAYEVARQMGCRCIIAERSETGRKIGRGFYIGKEDQVLVVDDVLTTGGSIRETLSALETTGARVVGIGVFIDRSSGVRFPFPFYAAHREEIQNYQPDNCPLCRAKVPLEIPGRGERP
ncbi:MAG: orotate phosphoribosyltransferase [candidate division WOR-3 bacterium]